MSSWHEFLTMGGYGAYVWPSYALVLVVMVINAILPGRRQRALLKQLRRGARNNGEPQ
ncbi:MAG: heme exporter protein CcmD [Gammaproteobacteria bacterium]|nr:heme exporter protein CcmD [Gammaproteobacteria bacterium]MDE2272797.1 heme exporter protein CcmD [Gammaproteobacteria bacterium]